MLSHFQMDLYPNHPDLPDKMWRLRIPLWNYTELRYPTYDRSERHDFWPQKENANELAKIVIKDHAFPLDPHWLKLQLNDCKNIYTRNTCPLKISAFAVLLTFGVFILGVILSFFYIYILSNFVDLKHWFFCVGQILLNQWFFVNSIGIFKKSQGINSKSVDNLWYKFELSILVKTVRIPSRIKVI